MFPPLSEIRWAYAILLNLLLCTFRRVWSHLIWVVTAGVESFRTVYGRVSAHPSLHQGVDPTWSLPYGLLGNTPTDGCGIPVDII